VSDYDTYTFSEKVSIWLFAIRVYAIAPSLVLILGAVIGYGLTLTRQEWAWAPALLAEGIVCYWWMNQIRNFPVALIVLIMLVSATSVSFWITWAG
jgi:hypothetical protein